MPQTLDHGLYPLVRSLQQHKTAASRLDKEVRRGNVSYSDVNPLIPRHFDTDTGKRLQRYEAMRAAYRTPQQLERTRALNDAVFRNTHAYNQRMMSLPDAPENPLHRLHNKLYPLVGPATHPKKGVFAPDTSGQFIRTILNNPRRAIAGTLHEPWLMPRAPVDSTLNRAMLAHELSEAATLLGDKHYPHASHAGVEPLLRESLESIGDPEAQQYLRDTRFTNIDDVILQKRIREMGGHPETPMPLHGRAQRNLEASLKRDLYKLNPKTRNAHLGHRILQEKDDILRHAADQELPLEKRTYKPTVTPNQLLPAEIDTAVREFGDTVRSNMPELKKVRQLRSAPTKAIRPSINILRSALKLDAPLGRYIKGI